VPTYHQVIWFQIKPTKAERQTGNAPAVAVETTKPTFVSNMVRETHLIKTPAIAAAITVTTVMAKSQSASRSEQTSLLLSIPNSLWHVGWHGVSIGILDKPTLIDNFGWDTTSPNRLDIKTHSGRPGSDVKPIPMWHRETGFNAHHPWSPWTKYARQHPAIGSANQQPCNEDDYITQPPQETRTGTRISIHIHLGYECQGDTVCNGEPKSKSLGSVIRTP
jgi:hypothetical protein